MNQKAKCQYDAENKIFHKHYFGNIGLADMLFSWENIINKNLIPKNTKRFILDYRKATLTIPPQTAKDIAAFYSKHADIFSHSQVAMIMENPNDVIFPILVNDELAIVNFKPFYTMEGAMDWLCM